MKIGIVLSNTPTYSETFFISKIKGLQESGFDVTLFVQQSDLEFELCDVVLAPKVYKENPLIQFFSMIFVLFKFLIQYPKRFIAFFQLERQAQRSLRRIFKNLYINNHLLRSDVHWLHFGFATMALQSEHVAKAIDAKMAVSLRGFDIDVYPEQHPHCYDLLWKHVDKVHSISNNLLKKAYQLGLSQEKMFSIITPAVDVSLFDLINHELSKDSVRVVTTARLHKIKGIKSIIDAMVILKNHSFNFEYLIIGDGPEHDNLNNQIKVHGIENEVILVGKKPHGEVAELLKLADIYVQYSESEGFCNAVLEAQAVGLLCIVSDGGALPENVLHEQTGWVVPKRNPRLLARTIQEVINLPEQEKAKVRLNARQRILKDFNLQKQQREFNEFYSE